ncbi:MAG TPA: FAD/NAD(P)-binding protein [Ignavibacteria bacterium]|nr:FAD/NAD(P)-binding protein [Ignavibacteria bacterium]
MGQNKKKIAIIGAGFCGLMTAIHLIRNAENPVEITLINDKYTFGKGIAYSTTSRSHLLNVPAAKMSCIPSNPDNFLDWLHEREPYSRIDRDMLGKMFVPRMDYGNYLLHIWTETFANKKDFVNVNIIGTYADDIEYNGTLYKIILTDGQSLETDYVVLATGNETPANPRIINEDFYSQPEYFANPWKSEAVSNLSGEGDILIIGSGLTMADTVLSLRENGFKNKIYCITRSGYNVLPHRHGGMAYSGLLEEIEEPFEIEKLFSLFRKHIKRMREFGLSAEPVIDSIRPITQKIWQKLTIEDKKKFLYHLKHYWNVARHRLPTHVADEIQKLRLNRKLIIYRGRVIDINKEGSDISVRFLRKRDRSENTLTVTRIINCSGPIYDITQTSNTLLKNLFSGGLIQPDELDLGLRTDTHGALINSQNKISGSFYTLGGNLRGLLWETTAVPELRVQAEKLAQLLIDKIAYTEEPLTA